MIYVISIWNFCRWVADISPRETFPAARIVDCFCKIVEIERYVLRAAILNECQNYLGAGAVWVEARKIEGL